MTASTKYGVNLLAFAALAGIASPIPANAQIARDAKMSDRAIAIDRQVQKTRETIEREAAESIEQTVAEIRAASALDPATPLVAGFEHQGRQIVVVDDPAKATGTRSIDPWLLSVNGTFILNPLDPNAFQPVVVSDCNAGTIAGTAFAAVLGHAKSRVDLYRDNELLASHQIGIWDATSAAPHGFSFNLPLESGEYRLEQGVYVFGNTPYNSGSVGFTVNNTASCASRMEYRGHIQGSGWTGWLQEDAVAGTTGQGRRLEAVSMRIVPAQGSNFSVCYQAHVRYEGWQSARCDGQEAGTTGQNRRMEAIKIWLPGAPSGCLVRYRVHMRGKGWSAWTTNGQVAGTTGENRRIEALQARLDGTC